MRILVTGGAGFIGCNAVKRFMGEGHEVTVLDDLSRKGSESNLKWLRSLGRFGFVKGDVRRPADLARAFRFRPDAVLHLAAQVAVTTSVTDPRTDFEINALGAFNTLEAVRKYAPKAAFVYSSTNKVYGEMTDLKVVRKGRRYAYASGKAVSEERPLDFHSPYGCSKGAADQYVIDYARIYGLRSVSLRQSCIYGYRQFGVEDQGWVAWFIIAAVLGKKITVYGDGMQVRDVLFVDDLVDCYSRCFRNMDKVKGSALNIGGGPANVMSLLELISLIEEYSGRKLRVGYGDWRPGDQKIFVCDASLAHRKLGWKPATGVKDGVRKLYDWVNANKGLFA